MPSNTASSKSSSPVKLSRLKIATESLPTLVVKANVPFGVSTIEVVQGERTIASGAGPANCGGQSRITIPLDSLTAEA